MEFFQVIETRRSVRKYHAKPVPSAVINKALDAALLAPNSSNMQPWEFYWVRDASKKQQLVKACFSQPAAATAAELVVITARRDTWKRNQQLMLDLLRANNAPKGALDYYTKLVPLAYQQGPCGLFGHAKGLLMRIVGLFRPVPRGPFGVSELFHMLIKTTALACENFMLAVVAQGYGCCPMEGFDEKMVKRMLGLGRESRVVMVISVGEVDPTGIYGPQVRHDRSLFVHEV